ncbi:unnamed protein product [Trypanosoma congolense IL3000]|uniref:WGS project CAEQ00000000 data, annotated contig 195 n=1 Tax=Trypanosoma congolense (strain IL3000) TaxID=1068625 RepID=F9WAB2_TRYCI|nr:unnamed protein product [Trypanosoma congolense IL3000]
MHNAFALRYSSSPPGRKLGRRRYTSVIRERRSTTNTLMLMYILFCWLAGFFFLSWYDFLMENGFPNRSPSTPFLGHAAGPPTPNPTHLGRKSFFFHPPLLARKHTPKPRIPKTQSYTEIKRRSPVPQEQGQALATEEVHPIRKRRREPSPTRRKPVAVEDTCPPRRIRRLWRTALPPCWSLRLWTPRHPHPLPTPKVSIPRKSFFLWAMPSDLGVVLLPLSRDPRRLNLYDFLEPVYPPIEPPLGMLTLADFVKSPKADLVSPYLLQEVLRNVPQLRKALREKMILHTWQLSSRNVRTLEDWAKRSTYELLEPLPPTLQEKAVWRARPQPWPAPAGVRTATPPSYGRRPCVVQLPLRRPPKAWTALKPIEDVLRYGSTTWEDMLPAEFLLEECGFPVHHSARPRASIAVFWQDPATYQHHEEARERVLQEMPAQLADRKARARVMGRSCMRKA